MQNFVTAKDLAIIYRPRRYLAQNHRWNLLYPKIKSDRNLNGWRSVKNSHLHWKGPDLSPALRITICPDTVLLFEPRINYPALRVTRINFCLKIMFFLWFSYKFSMKFTKNHFFSLFQFFRKMCKTLFALSTSYYL